MHKVRCREYPHPAQSIHCKTAVTQSRRTVGAEVAAEYPDFFVTTVEQLFCRRPAAVIVVNADGGKVFKAKLLSVCRTQYTGQFYPCKAPLKFRISPPRNITPAGLNSVQSLDANCTSSSCSSMWFTAI